MAKGIGKSSTAKSTSAPRGRSAAEDSVVSRQEQIFFEASKLFVNKGFAGASMSDIAEAVGVTKAGLYHFVENKEELLYTIVSYGMDRLFDQVVKPASAIADPLERLRTIIRMHARNIGDAQTNRGNPVTIAVNEVSGLSVEHRQEIDAQKKFYIDFVKRTLTELRADGRLRDDLDITVAAFSIIGMVIFLTHWQRPNGRLSREEVEEQVVTLAVHAVVKD